METSQQQRRSAIGAFASALKDADLPFDALDLIDSLWLAQFHEPGESNPPNSQPDALPNVPARDASVTGSAERSLEEFGLYASERKSPQANNVDEIEAEQSNKSKEIPFSVSAASALRTRLDLARSLRPLMRKVPSHQHFDLDEDATVTQIAETEVWMPVVRASPERWLELDLVVEDSKTTTIWERSIAELVHLAEYQGAFRAVRTWRLQAESGEVKLFPRWQEGSTVAGSQSRSVVSQRPRSPRELIDPTGRRLVWVVTDCTSLLWQQAFIYETLMDWSQVQSVSIVQMFPERLWSRTALQNGHIVKLSAFTPGVASAQMVVDGLPRRLVQRGGTDLVTVPVVTVEPETLAQWARVVSGAGDVRTAGRSFDLAFIRKQAERAQASSESSELRSRSERTAAERVALFRSTSSKTVRILANLMAAVPVSLPVIDLLREEFRSDFEEEVRQSHVAEVLLSGLLRRCDARKENGAEVCRYEFFGDGAKDRNERVRDILLGDASITKTIEVLDVLSRTITNGKPNQVKTFEALLRQIQDSDELLDESILPFASVGRDVLLRLGGRHAEFARQIDLKSNPSAGKASVDGFPPIVDFEFNQVQLIEDERALSTETFTIRTLERRSPEMELEPFTFTVATLQAANGQWQVQRRQQSARCFVEPLPFDQGLIARTLAIFRKSDTLPLEMVAIPGGRFLMGSSVYEEGHKSNESPQREVDIEPFFMGRYPVNQAQWRSVAAMPRIQQKLNPNPSRFSGDRLPVEQVSWKDVVEFCARLSAYTGRQYCSPTEAQWEYACRARTTTPFHFGDTITTEVANYDGSAYAAGPQGKSRRETTPVDHFGIANAFGLSDMHGNVWEWCQDSWHSSYEGVPSDGKAWLTDSEAARHVVRGGSWLNIPRLCRSASRGGYSPGVRDSYVGFRVSCVAPRTLQ